jgi:transposase
MDFYTNTHKYYCGIDLHAKSLYICILDQNGTVLIHKEIKANPTELEKAISDYKEDLVIAVECTFTWYWIADFCLDRDIAFVLGHALYMKAIHGGKAKNDKIDSRKIAVLLKGGMLPKAYVYPRGMRATRDLLRRRMHLMRKRSELLAHIHNTNSQYNLPSIGFNLRYKKNREAMESRFEDKSVQRSVDLDLALIGFYDNHLQSVERFLEKNAKIDDYTSFMLLQSVPGIGVILALVILFEIHTIDRFPKVQNFVSYSRLVKCKKESGGKSFGTSGAKIGNAHLKWAFSEAAVLFLRKNPEGQKYLERLSNKHGKAKALSILAHKLGRTVFFMLKNKQPFNLNQFLNHSADEPRTVKSDAA